MRGFGFIDCKAYSAVQPEEKQKDVFMLPSLVEHICSGKKNVIDLSKQSETSDLTHLRIRVQFKVGAHPDGKVGAIDVRRFLILCHLCEEARAARMTEREAEKARKAAAAASADTRPAISKPGFNPSAKLGALLGSLRGEMGVPAPGAPGARLAPNIQKGSRGLNLPKTRADHAGMAGLLRSTAANPMKYAQAAPRAQR